MNKFYIIGLKSYSSELQSHLADAMLQNPNTKFSMLSIDPRDTEKTKTMNAEHREHSHYFLLDENAIHLLDRSGIKTEILGIKDLNQNEIKKCIVCVQNK